MLRKLFILGLLFTISISTLIAQPRFDPKERAKELKERLKLDDKQTKQVEDIFAKQTEQMQNMFSGNGGDREKMRDQMMKLREETNKKIEKILTDKQKAEYKKYQEEIQARRQQMRPGGN